MNSCIAESEFTLTTSGLADQMILDKNWKPSDSVLWDYLSPFPRHTRKGCEKFFRKTAPSFMSLNKKTKLFDIYMNQEFRRGIFWFFIKHIEKKTLKTLAHKPSISIEYGCFKQLFNDFSYELTEDDRKERKLKDFFLDAEKPEELPEDYALVDKTIIEKYNLTEDDIVPVLNLWDKASNRLSNKFWMDKDDVCAGPMIMAFATVLGPEFFKKAIEIYPPAFDELTYIQKELTPIKKAPAKKNVKIEVIESPKPPIQLPQSKEISAKTAAKAVEPEDDFPEDIKKCLELLKGQVGELVPSGLNVDHLKHLAELTIHIGRLAETETSTERFEEAIRLIHNYLDTLAEQAEISGMQDAGFREFVHNEWCRHFAEYPENISPSDDTVHILKQVKDNVSAIAASRREYLTTITQTEENLNQLQTALPADFVSRIKAKEEITKLEGEIASCKQNLSETEIPLHEAILPEGSSFDQVGQEEKVPHDSYPAIKKQAMEGLQAVLEALTEPSQALVEEPPEEQEETEASPEEDAPVEVHPEVPEGPEGITEPQNNIEAKEDQPDIEAEIPEPQEPEPVEKKPVQAEAPAVKELPQEEDPALRIDSKTPLKTRIEVSLKKYNQIAPADANQLSLQCAEKGFINLAHQVLCVAEEMENPEPGFLPEKLLEAVFYGRNTWASTDRTFEHSQRILNTFDPRKIEGWLENRVTSRAVPPLLFSACLQPALWGGINTLAPQILSQIKLYLDPLLQELITDLTPLWNKGATFSLEKINKIEGGTENTGLSAKVRLKDWQDKITQTTKGWAPLRQSLSKCLKDGAFTRVVKIIDSDDKSAIKEVQQFVSEYGNSDKSRNLLQKMANELDAAKIETFAFESFRRTVDELREIGQLWMAGVPQRKDLREEIKNMSHQLITRLEKFITSADKNLDQNNDSSTCLANTLMLNSLRRLLAVIDGRESLLWPDARLELWLNAAKPLMSGFKPDASPNQLIKWVLNQVESGFDVVQMYQGAFKCEAYHIAHLLLETLSDENKDMSAEAAALQKAVGEELLELNRCKDHVALGANTASFSGLIQPERHSQIVSELEYIEEEIKSRSMYTDLRKISEPLKEMEREVDALFTAPLRDLKNQYDSLLNTALANVGPEVVTDEWRRLIEDAFQNKDIPVVEEMLETLENASNAGNKIRLDSINSNSIFPEFLKNEETLYRFLSQTNDPSEIMTAYDSEGPVGLTEPDNRTSIRTAVRAIASLRSSRPKSTLDKTTYENIVVLLQPLGLIAREKHSADLVRKSRFKIVEGLTYLQLNVDPCNAGAPFSDFGKNQGAELEVLIAHKMWDQDRFEKAIEQIPAVTQRFVMISTAPLNRTQRNQFAAYCKDTHRTVFLIDPVALLYLGSLPTTTSNADTIRNFLHLSVPMTYYNTYVGDKQEPPEPEMRYGRANEIQQLLGMNRGAAIAFGGRQLGKSTILFQVKEHFHDPLNKKYAFELKVDKDRLAESTAEQRERRVWSMIHEKFCGAGLIQGKSDKSTEAMRADITHCLIKKKDLRVMVLFDESDKLLSLDHADDFAIMRGIRALVSSTETEGQFKFIIGGLHNVKRFEDSPNYPLNQLGGSLNISIMSVADATKLIKEPLQTFGYRFENPLVARRILSYTNRHPSLIQIFCKELTKHLAYNFSGDIAEQVITDSDVARVSESEEVKRLIRQRFEMTMNLDKRYAIIIYSLALERRGVEPFSAAQVRDSAKPWLPELANKTNMQIEAILEELVGLGVLRKTAGNTFALRNSNVLSLLGTQSTIEMKLLGAQDSLQNDDPLDLHAYIDKLHVPSALTYRDEKQLLGTLTNDEKAKPNSIKKVQAYTVSLISGSKALGLDALEKTLPYTEDYSLDWTSNDQTYKLVTFSDTSFSGLKGFGARLQKQIKLSEKNPQIIYVKLTGKWSDEEMYAALDIAHQAKDSFRNSYKNCKVVFSASPRALWNWLSGAQEIARQEQTLSHISLNRWKDNALSALLEKIGFTNTQMPLDTLKEFTHGWHAPLDYLSELKKSSPEVTTIRKFGAKFKKITDLTINNAQAFLDFTGINDVPWGVPLLLTLMKELNGEGFNEEDMKLALIEMDGLPDLTEDDVAQALEWLTRLSIIEMMPRKRQSDLPLYQVQPAVKANLEKVHA